jgi:hypothetical protein
VTGQTRRLWLVEGWLMIGFVVLTFAGAAYGMSATLGDTQQHLTKALVTSSLSATLASGYVEFVATLVFLVAVLLLAQLLRGSDELTGWFATVLSATAVVYTAVSVAAGLATVAAAVYDGHHGVPLATVTAVNDIRNVAFSLSGGVVGVLTLAAGAAGRRTGLLPRWLCNTGYAVGVIMIAAVPAAKAGAPQTLLWFAWLLALGVTAVRSPQRHGARSDDPVAVSA